MSQWEIRTNTRALPSLLLLLPSAPVAAPCAHSVRAALFHLLFVFSFFIRVYTYAPLNVYLSMIRAASLYRQTLRVDEYFKLLLRFHAPTTRVMHLVLAAHAQCGHTDRVLQLIEQMQNGTSLLDELGAEESQKAQEESGALYDPTTKTPRSVKKLHRNVAFKYPFTERCLFYLLQCHAVNDDSEAIRALVRTLAESGHFYEQQVGPLRLTAQLADLLMHYYALQRMTSDSVALLRWVQREALPVGPTLAYFFFDAFKREAAMRQLHETAPSLAMEELTRRARKEPADAPVAQKRNSAQEDAPFDPLAIPAPPQQSSIQLLQAAMAPAARPGSSSIQHHSPFPAEANSTTVPSKLASDFPASPVRRQRRLLQPSPVDRRKEAAPLESALAIMVQEHEFVPSANLVNIYLAYYGENFIPPGTFPDVMAAQCRLFEQQLAPEQLLANVALVPEGAAVDPEALECAAPFRPNARTYALLIQALFDRNPLRSTAPSSLALRRPGPSHADIRAIRALRAEMHERAITPLLQTKINMMQLMVYEERWSDLYAAFSLLWKADKIRRDNKLSAMRNAEAAPATATAESGSADLAGDAEAEEDADRDPAPVAFRSRESAPFTCMTLLPVVVSLSQRASLDRMNLFVGILSGTKDFPLSAQFFQGVLQVLADRGNTKEIVDLLRTIKNRYAIRPTILQYNTLLASLVHKDDSATAGEGAVEGPDPQARLVTLFQTFELMKLLGIPANAHTWHIMLTGVMHYGALVDGQRLWKYLLFKAGRPTLPMYTTYVSFLLRHNQLEKALYTLRSQSFKDGIDWSLKECYLLLDYFQKHLLAHVQGAGKKRGGQRQGQEQGSAATEGIQREVDAHERQTGQKLDATEEDNHGSDAAATATGSGLSAAQSAAVYVPTAEQLAAYQEIQTRCRDLRVVLLEHEKAGGRLGRRGMLDLVAVPGQQPLALRAHRRLVSPAERSLHTPLSESKEEEEVLMTPIPGTFFQRYLVPLMNKVEQFAGTYRYKPAHLRDQRTQIQLLAQTLQAEQADKPTRYEPQPEELQPIPLTPDESAQADVVLQSISDAIAAEAGASAAKDAMASPAATVADPSEAESTVPQTESKPRAASKRRTAAASEAESASAGAAPSAEQLEEFARRKAAREALKAAKAAKKAMVAVHAVHAAHELDEMARPSGEQRTPVAIAVEHALHELGGKADKTRTMLAPLSAPTHPAMLDDIDLCALHAADRLSTLTIPQLKAVQTHPQLMQQPQLLVKGIKSHHLKVVDTWLKHCTCCAHTKAQ